MRRIVVASVLIFPMFSHGASFRCSEATTEVEKTICANPRLSALDDELDRLYREARAPRYVNEDQEIIDDQRRWLVKRNRCKSEACVISAYEARIQALKTPGPFADQKITCAEMEQHPRRVFSTRMDLGSGFGSPVEVNYDCPGSLASLPFLKSLSNLTEAIRAEDGRQECTGSIVHAHWRSYRFMLAAAGYYPQLFLNTYEGEAGAGTQRYFEQWGLASPYNYDLYARYIRELETAKPLLLKHYRGNFKLSKADAEKAAQGALMVFLERAAGTYPESGLKPESALLAAIIAGRSNLSRLRQMLDDLPDDADGQEEAYRTLKAALYLGRPPAQIEMLLSYAKAHDFAGVERGDESALFAALKSRANVRMLLDAGEPVNYANSFGKTALYYAIEMGDRDLVALLVDRGADVNHAYPRPEHKFCYPIHQTGRTPLMHAAQHSDAGMLELLIQRGANAKKRDDLDKTALDYAIAGGRQDNVEYLVSKGVISGAPLYPNDRRGRPVSFATTPATQTLSLNGFVHRLRVPATREGLVIASVVPYHKVAPEPQHGVYLFGASGEGALTELARIAPIRAEDIAVTSDGRRLFVLHTNFGGMQASDDYGLQIYDISDPAKPIRVQHVAGDFQNMHLAPSGKHIYLQGRTLNPDHVLGTVVYRITPTGVELQCENAFLGRYAYEIAQFKDDSKLIFTDRGRDVYFYDVTDVCRPKELLHIDAQELGHHFVAGSNGVFLSDHNGLMSSRFGEKATRVDGWFGAADFIAVSPGGDRVAVGHREEVGLASIGREGEIQPFARYALGGSTGALTDSGWLFVGGNEYIKAVRTQPQ